MVNKLFFQTFKKRSAEIILKILNKKVLWISQNTQGSAILL